MRPSAANGASTEQPLPKVLTAVVPQVPSAVLPLGAVEPWVVPTPSSVGAPYVPAAVAAGLKGGAVVTKVLAAGPALPISAVPRRQSLQTNVATGRKVLRPCAPQVVRQAKDAAPRRKPKASLVAVIGATYSQ